ncbi:Proton channel OTOP3, partial [Galemys pyrenaicus]
LGEKMDHVSRTERFMELSSRGCKSPCPPRYKAPIRPSVGETSRSPPPGPQLSAGSPPSQRLSCPSDRPHPTPPGGLVLFGICTLVMDVFKTGYYSSFYECLSAIKILHPITQAVFVIVQTYFLWVSAKDCIHVHLDLTRCGLMFTLTTNLAIWMAAVVDESVHQAQSYGSSHGNTSHARLSPDPERAGSTTEGECPCSTAICQIFQQGYFYLYPFNIEYSLFACTMLYVMWKNVGRLLASSSHGHGHGPPRGSLFRETFFAGPVLGLTLFVVGLAVFVLYEVQVNGEGSRTHQALVTYYSFSIVCLGLMTLVSLSGSIIYRFDRRAMDHHKNPTRTLDVALLMGAALGQYAISYYSIVAVVVGTSRDLLAWLNLAHALLMIAQHTFQNVFIIESLHRGPPGAVPQDTPPKEPCHGLTFANLDALQTLPACPTTPQLVFPGPSAPQEAVAVMLAPRSHWRRRCLKDISLFLLLCNVILWVMPAFGARPHFSNTTEVDFYGTSLWTAIVNICLPFGIFYRMHAVSSLLEVYAPPVASAEAQETGTAPAKETRMDAGSEASGAPGSPRQQSWLVRHFSLLLRWDQQAQKAGQLFSGLLALNVVFLGGAFICSMIFNNVAVTLGDVWILLAALKALSILWLLYYSVGTTRRPHAVLHRDPHAGPIWVRGSLVLFGSCTVCLNVFRVGYDMSHIHCKSQLELIFPAIEIVFICVQTWVLLKHCKDCVQVQSNFTRCGLMMTLATNLLLWVLATTNDSMHREIEAELSALMEKFSGNDTNTCLCLNATACEVFRKGYLMLYPFSTEYCLICCAVLFVMWKNVGRHLAPHAGARPGSAHFHLHGAIFGPLLGLLALVAGVCVFVLFQIQAGGPAIARQYFTVYYAFYVAVLPAMSLACLAGTAIHRLEERELDTLKNPTRSLDVVLLMGAALGQMGIAYFSIVAIVATRPLEQLNRLILAYSLLLILQHMVQNLFIIEGLHRRPLGDGERPGEQPPRRGSLLELGQDVRRASLAYLHSYGHLNWKQRALKEISLFLILCNVTLWMMPAFGVHPEFENGLEKEFYGYRTWFTIVNFGLPLGVFYRMHSVGGLVEVYLGA